MKELQIYELQTVTGGIDNLPGNDFPGNSGVPGAPQFGSALWYWLNGHNGQDGAPRDDRDRTPSR